MDFRQRAWTWIVGLSVLAGSGCTPRELAWLVPRASVGVAIRTHEGHVAGAGFVTLVSPLEPPLRATRRSAGGGRARWRLLGEPTPCRVAEACRWEGRARAGTLADLAEDELLDGWRTP
jgi:hypothetical protein